MKPIRKTYADLTSELQRFIRGWKHTHSLTDVQVVALLALVSAEYAQAAYVSMSQDDKNGDRHKPHAKPE